MADIKIITAVTAEPLSIDEVKEYLHEDEASTVQDAVIRNMITAAREYCEEYTGRALATQTLEARLDYFPCRDFIDLPRPPLQSVTSVIYTDSAGVATTMAANTAYLVDADSVPGRIVLPYGVSWPTFTAYPVNPIKIRYITGYSSTNRIPKTIRQAMLLLIGHWFANREAAGSISKEIEFSVRALLTLHRVRWF